VHLAPVSNTRLVLAILPAAAHSTEQGRLAGNKRALFGAFRAGVSAAAVGLARAVVAAADDDDDDDDDGRLLLLAGLATVGAWMVRVRVVRREIVLVLLHLLVVVVVVVVVALRLNVFLFLVAHRGRSRRQRRRTKFTRRGHGLP
jgi:hypothetical protein